jgi:hypothetical protein
MTDVEKIIKAISHCQKGLCESCPIKIDTDCNLFDRIINLITTQKAEIEELTEKHHSECRQIAKYDDESKLFSDIGKLYSEIRTEAVKKFAEALKAEIKNLSKVHLFGATFALVGESFVDGFVEKYEKGE